MFKINSYNYNLKKIKLFLLLRHFLGFKKKDLQKRNAVIFISHDLTRTGAPKVLLTFLNWLKTNTDLEFIVVAPHGGALEEDFKKITKTFVLSEDVLEFFEYLRNYNIGLIYSNTVVNGRLQKLFSTMKFSQICHVHEMPEAIKGFGLKNMKRVKSLNQEFIVVSEAVKEGLIKECGFCEDKITKINAFIDLPQINNSKKEIEKLKAELGITENTFVLGSVGGFHFHKGADLAIELAKDISTKIKDFKYVWLGADINKIEQKYLDLIKESGLENVFKIIPPTNNPYLYYELFDVFVMCSRMDSFPLVNLEAGFMKKPVVCFKNSGGTAEFVGEDCGFTCPDSDIEYMADKIVELKNDKALIQQFGKNAYKKVTEELNTGTLAPKIYKRIKKYI